MRYETEYSNTDEGHGHKFPPLSVPPREFEGDNCGPAASRSVDTVCVGLGVVPTLCYT